MIGNYGSFPKAALSLQTTVALRGSRGIFEGRSRRHLRAQIVTPATSLTRLQMYDACRHLLHVVVETSGAALNRCR
jgi:hypothetical protein